MSSGESSVWEDLEDLGITQFEPRMYFIQRRMDELLGVYSRNNWGKNNGQ